MSKKNLTEATMLALQGKLLLDEDKEIVEEDVNISIDDDTTEIDTDDSLITILDKDAQVVDDIDLSTIDDVVVIPVESDETVIPEEIVPEETVEDEDIPTVEEIVDDEVVEEPTEEETVEDEKPEEIEESKEIKTEEIEEPEDETISEDMTDSEIAKFIASNFEKITGVDIDTIYSNEDSEVPFNQPVIDKTSPIILKVLEDANIAGKRLENVLYLLDDELISIRDTGKTTESKEVKKENVEIDIDSDEETGEVAVEVTTDEGEEVEVVDETEEPKDSTEVETEEDTELAEVPETGDESVENDEEVETEEEIEESKKLKTEAAGELSGKLYDYFDEMGYMDGAQGEIINAFISWLSEDDIKRFAEIYEYPIFDEEEEIEESKEVCKEDQEEKCPHCGKEKCECSKEIQYNVKTFNEVLSKYYKEKYKAVESFETSKLFKSDNGLKIEGKLINNKNESKEITVELSKVQEGTTFTKYKVQNTTGLLKENKQKEVLMMTRVTENTLNCRYVTEK